MVKIRDKVSFSSHVGTEVPSFIHSFIHSRNPCVFFITSYLFSSLIIPDLSALHFHCFELDLLFHLVFPTYVLELPRSHQHHNLYFLFSARQRNATHSKLYQIPSLVPRTEKQHIKSHLKTRLPTQWPPQAIPSSSCSKPCSLSSSSSSSSQPRHPQPPHPSPSPTPSPPPPPPTPPPRSTPTSAQK